MPRGFLALGSLKKTDKWKEERLGLSARGKGKNHGSPGGIVWDLGASLLRSNAPFDT